jgi:Uma2 family endonuclease
MVAEPDFKYVGEYDENLPLPKRLTREQYNRVIFRPDAHFVDGAIIARNLGDTVHNHMIGDLIGGLHQPCKDLGLHACISLRLQTSPTCVRVCDFAILKADAPYEPVPTVPPHLCIEVLSRGQQPDTELNTLADYLAMGVKNIWLIDPIRRAAFTFDTAGLHEADPTNLTVPNSPIRIDLTEAFAALD